jgi:superfamily II DNA/RNA helicase
VTADTAPSFADLGLAAPLLRAAAAAGWAVATPIQAAALPVILQGRDLLALAPTGSGKTAAFVLPLLQRLAGDAPGLAARPRPLRALVLAPTHELARQIGAVAQALSAALAPAPRLLVAVGGVSINPQLMALRGGVHGVVATPGRLLDLLAHNALHLADVDLLVLDEADRLLDLGFADELGRIVELLPAQRQTLLFSATMPDAVAALAARVLRDPQRIETAADTPAGAPPAITQRAIEVDTPRRSALARQLIVGGGWKRVLVFVATQYASEHVADKLRRNGVPAEALHGRLSAGRRSQVLADFQAQRLRVLVATDLAARGLDIPGLDAVLNFDLPRSAVDYTHRIGRTGRAGAVGVALSFICADAPGSEAHFRLIEKRQAQRVPRERCAGFEPAAPLPATLLADPHGGAKGRRKSKKDKLREAAAQAAAAPAAPSVTRPRRPAARPR